MSISTAKQSKSLQSSGLLWTRRLPFEDTERVFCFSWEPVLTQEIFCIYQGKSLSTSIFPVTYQPVQISLVFPTSQCLSKPVCSNIFFFSTSFLVYKLERNTGTKSSDENSRLWLFRANTNNNVLCFWDCVSSKPPLQILLETPMVSGKLK